jgi:enoyl-CoA hydratase/carnithine racemase
VAAEPLVRRHTDRGIAVVTLDSPHNRNALSTALVGQLRATLDEAEGDSAVRAVLLTHTGSTFCSGADLTADNSERGPLELVALLLRIAALDLPVVAQVNGHARAGGIGLMAVCDIAVAGAGATFAFSESRLGLAPSVISVPVMARADPRAIARYFLTGERFGTEEAVRIGLVTAGAEALDGMLEGLRAASPQGLAASKRLVNEMLLHRLTSDAPDLARESARLFGSAEAAEGIRALLERREPPWAL